MKYKLKIKNLHKVFTQKKSSIEAIKNLNFEVSEGEIVAIVGTSGCGKSTLLNIIAGLEKDYDGKCIFNKENPRISYMLQSDALLPWRTVLSNAILGLELMHEDTEENIDYVKKLLVEYGLEDFLDKKTNSLSGGMKQRVALIRSLAIKPDILLLDEPFSALDYYTRISIADDVYKIIKESNTTTVIITHDIAEALSLADRVIVLSSRPSTVKNIYELNFPTTKTTKEKRSLPEFNIMYEKIWGDLDVKI